MGVATVSEDTDEELMLRYGAGDLAAFERVYRRHRAPLYRYFLRQLGGHAACEDLFQEVWRNIIQAAARYRPSAKFSTYLYTVAHNCLVDHLRREGRRGATTEADALQAPDRDSPEQAAQAAQLAARLGSAIGALPREQRDAFLLRAEGGLSLAQIAQVTGVKQETAKSRLRYAFARLRQEMPRDLLTAKEHDI